MDNTNTQVDMNKINTKKMILSNAVFKRLFGVKKETFEKMLSILQKKYAQNHKFGGRPPKLSVKDKLMITLKYLHEYWTMEHIGHDYMTMVSAKVLFAKAYNGWKTGSKKILLSNYPAKRCLKKPLGTIEYVVVDVTESPIQRPKETIFILFQKKETVYHKNTDCH